MQLKMIMKYWEVILGEKSPPHSSFSFFVLWAATPQRSLLSQTFDVLDRKLSSLKEKEMVAAHGCFSYFSLQTMGKTPTRSVFRPEVWYSLETIHNRPCITGFKGSGSLYQCNKSEGRCLHVCQQHALESRKSNWPPGKSQLLACRLPCHAAVIQSLSKAALHFDKAWKSVTNTTWLGRDCL